MKCARHVVLLTILCLVEAGCARPLFRAQATDPQSSKDSAWLAQLSQGKPCTRPEGVQIVAYKNVSADAACILTTSALRQIAAGHGATRGLLAADSARVIHAVVGSFDALDVDTGKRGELYWAIDMRLKGTDVLAIVYFDRLNHTIRFRYTINDW